MDKNQTTGFLLMAAVFFGYMWYMKPTDAELQAYNQKRDSLERLEQNTSGTAQNIEQTPHVFSSDSSHSSVIDSAQLAREKITYGIFANHTRGVNQQVILENSELKVTIDALGARVSSVILKNHKTHDQKPLELIDADSSNLSLGYYSSRNSSTLAKTSALYFESVNKSDSAVDFVLRGENQEKLMLSYKLNDAFLLDLSVKTENLQDLLFASSEEFILDWSMYTIAQEKNIKNSRNLSSVYYKYDREDPSYITESAYEREDLIAKTRWVSFKQQFFSSSLMAKANFAFGKTGAFIETVAVNEEDTIYNEGMLARLSLPMRAVNNTQFDMQFYYGPNHYQTLQSMNLGLEDQLNLGWGIFGWVNKYVIIPTFNFLDKSLVNYGLIILLLTLIIKTILLPITYKSYVSSAKMKLIKPEVDALNKKYENKDPLEKQQATMALYRKTGVSPLSGCIPALIQMPILLAMFKFFPASIELRQKSFLWANDLSSYDSIYELGFNIPFYGSHVSLFTILMAISIYLYSKYNMNSTSMPSGPQAQQMKLMTSIMPVMMLFFFNGYSAALSFYYFLSNCISLIQQFFIKKFMINEDKLRAQIEANKKKNKNVKKSSFQKRMEEMAKQRGMKK